MYSFGIVVWEMVTNRIPYPKSSSKEVMNKVKNGELVEIPENCHPILISKWIVIGRDFVRMHSI